MRIEEFIHTTTHKKNINDIFKIFQKELESFGFNRALFALLNEHTALQKESQYGLVHNYPKDWINHYIEKKYVQIDPVIKAAFTQHSVFTWGELQKTKKMSLRQQLIFNEAEEAGLLCGAGIPLFGKDNTVAGFGISSSEKSIDSSPTTLNKVHLMAQQFYLCFWRIMELKPEKNEITLTQREEDVIKWLAKGLTASDIADRLIISTRTVNFHIGNIKAKLDAKNITSAVVKALNKRLVHL